MTDKKTPVSVTPFLDAVAHKNERLSVLSRGSQKILGYFCTYTPIEMMHAAGFLPVRIFGETGRVESADSLTPNFICPYMRRALEKRLKGEYDYLSGVIQGYTCDVACGMMNIWEENITGLFYHTIPLPYNDNPAAREFLRSALEEFSTKLEGIGGKISDEALGLSLELYEKIRVLILGLYDLRNSGKLPMTAPQFYAVIQAGFITPPQEYLDMLKTVLGEVDKADGADSGDRKRAGIPVLVTGSLVEEPMVYEIFEESGGRIVADDLCTGFRNFYPASGKGDTPMERLIDRYMNRFPCPSRTRAKERIPAIMELIRRSGALGIVFLFQKFCTPHLADYPILVEALREHKIPSILIEMEETGIIEGQFRTRLEGFFEMLER